MIAKLAENFIEKVRDERVQRMERERDDFAAGMMNSAHQTMGTVMHREAQWSMQREKLNKTIRSLNADIGRIREKLVPVEAENIALKKENGELRIELAKLRNSDEEFCI